ncbi:MAG: hypothetical protein ACLGI5_15550 [Thermoleophilia bacterium]
MSEAVLAPSPLPRRRTPSRPPLRLAAGSASVALRVAEAALEVSGSRTMDRLVRSRAWVVIVAFGLIGIVAMQVSMLKLNNGIGRAVETAATLERSNATLRGEISRLSSGDRIHAMAATRGFVMPEPADVTYLRAATPSADGRRAAKRMRAPDAQIAGPAGSPLFASTAAPSLTAPSAHTAPPADGAAAAASAATAATVPAATTPAGTPQTAGQQAAPAPQTSAPPQGPALSGAASATPGAAAATPSGGVTIP